MSSISAMERPTSERGEVIETGSHVRISTPITSVFLIVSIEPGTGHSQPNGRYSPESSSYAAEIRPVQIPAET